MWEHSSVVTVLRGNMKCQRAWQGKPSSYLRELFQMHKQDSCWPGCVHPHKKKCVAPEWCWGIGKAVCADLLKPGWACYLFPFHRSEQGEDPADWNWFCLFLSPCFHWLICIHVFLGEMRLNAPSTCLSPGLGHINYDSALLTLPVLLEVETRFKKNML